MNTKKLHNILTINDTECAPLLQNHPNRENWNISTAATVKESTTNNKAEENNARVDAAAQHWLLNKQLLLM